MALNILRYEFEGKRQWGVVRDSGIVPIPGDFATTGDFLRSNSPATLRELTDAVIEEHAVQIVAPVTSNQQFICQGANYRQHMIESGLDPDQKHFNMLFRKASSCIVPADAPLLRPAHVALLDYEIELGLVIKCDVTEPVVVRDVDLHRFVAGIVIVNDYSARDVQIPQMQFYKGKSYRTFGPVGPYLCLLEEADFETIGGLNLELTVNGEVRQRDTTANLVFGPAETLSELSSIQDLSCGDLIATGTPSGCALRIPSPLLVKILGLLPERTKWRLFINAQSRRTQYLNNGDVVESRIYSEDGRIDLGVQRNEVMAAHR